MQGTFWALVPAIVAILLSGLIELFVNLYFIAKRRGCAPGTYSACIQLIRKYYTINMNKQQYSSPVSKAVQMIVPVTLCQGSPIDPYTGHDLGDDFEEE